MNALIQFYNLPKWAKYAAQDDTGQWWAFGGEPELCNQNCCWNYGGLKEKIYPVIKTTLNKISK